MLHLDLCSVSLGIILLDKLLKSQHLGGRREEKEEGETLK